jgi:hypothetical protein
MRSNGIRCLLLFGALILLDCAHAQETPYTILKGKVERKDYHTYIEKPFTLPDGVKRLRVEFFYTGKEQRTTIDIGLMDPVRFRGWSGGARNVFTISAEDATPGIAMVNVPRSRASKFPVLFTGLWKLRLLKAWISSQ